MLSNEEELRLASFLDVLKVDLEKDPKGTGHEYKIEALLWLAEKLKETNNELKSLPCRGSVYSCFRGDKEVEERILKPEQEQSDSLRKLYSPKNEISDRFYPRD